MKHIHLVNGPNLNLLGRREPAVYGHTTWDEHFLVLQNRLADLAAGVILHQFQSNHEGALIDYLHQHGFAPYTGIVLNAGALTHTSIALADAVLGIETPVIEVHISNVHAREPFRHHSYISAYAVGVIVGLGIEGYEWAVRSLANRLS